MKINYLAIEGNEGSGKTSLSKNFAELIKAFYTYEPNGETEELKTLREMALNEKSQINVMGRELLLLANRSIHIDFNIKPRLSENKKIVTDRCFLSGMVYANYHGLRFNKWFELCKKSGVYPFPQMIIYVQSDIRKIDKKIGDIYDNAGEDNLRKIDDIFERALEFIGENTDCSIIRFHNDFKKNKEYNANNLLNTLLNYGVNFD